MRVLVLYALMVVSTCAQVTYKIRLTANDGNRVIEVPAEQYVAGVLAGESSTFQSDEALKAMAVAARTYAARLHGRHASEGFDFCATTHCQRFELRNIPARLTKAAAATEGELLWYDGRPAYAVYTRDCGGMIESVASVWPDIQTAYLPAHADPYCNRQSSPWSWIVAPAQITSALRASKLNCPDGLRRILVRSRTASGRAQTLELEGNSTATISAGAFRFAIGRELGWNTIRSDLYEVQNSAEITFYGKGQGHGVGLCQAGAEQMGTAGHSYRDILAFYYPGTSVSRLATGFHWVPMVGDGVTVLSERPDLDRAVLHRAETARRKAQARLRLDGPAGITVRVYPDLDAFRNATAEPGWVAAHTARSTIDLQPATVLNRTGALNSVLNHEMLHVILENHAASGLPVWFLEGLVEYLCNEPGSDNASTDADLSQRKSRAAAQHAYASAAARVSALVAHYGEATVLGWISRGLPAEVKNSSDNSAAIKSR